MASGEPRPAIHPPAAVQLALVWAALFGLYVLLVGSLSVNEALAGGGSALLATIWWACAGRIGGKHFEGWAPALRPLGGALLALPAATAKVAGQLLRVAIHGGPPGAVAYRREADSAWAKAELPAERALGLIAVSLSPDSYILREDGGGGGVLDHALDRAGSPR